MIGAEEAHTLDVEGCEPDCKCQRVHFVMRDEAGNPISIISISPLSARDLARELFTIADVAEGRIAKQKGRLS